jgi:hypothetical protein
VAPAGTVIELMVHEAHQVGGPALLNTHFNAWTRFVCKEGTNEFETFDFESVKWIQLHIRNTQGSLTVSNVGVRRTVYPWPHQPDISCSDMGTRRDFIRKSGTLGADALLNPF